MTFQAASPHRQRIPSSRFHSPLRLQRSNGTLTTQGAELLAKQSVNLSAGTVDLQAVQNTAQSAFHSETHSVTVGSALAGVVGSKITAITDSIELAQRTDNARLQGAAALKGAYDAYKLAGSLAAPSAALSADVSSGAAVGVSYSIGVSESHQDSSSAQTQVRGTSVQAKDISITSTQGDLSAAAAKLQADNITLEAAKRLNLVAGTNHEQNSSTSSSSSMGAGVTFGGGSQSGISLQISAAQSSGKSNGSETVYDNTQVTAAKRLTTKSGKDTNLIGAQLAANTVKMEVGTSGKGDLNIQTLQDKSSFESQQSSSGFSLSLCIPPLCAGAPVTGSISQSQQSIDHNYQSAVGQSGIAAGTGGFDINVAGNTDLQGAAITSSAAKEQNTLQTQTLSASDLTNRQSTSSHSMSVSAGTGMSAMAAAATNALSNLTGNADLPKNMSEQSSTLSVISPAVISITGNDTQGKTTSEQVASTLTSRDDATANQTLTNTLTLQQAAQLEQQQKTAQQNQQAANLVGAVMANSIGDLAQKQGWTEGSAQKTLLHGLSGAIQASIAGGNIGAGFASAALNEQLTPVMDQYLKSQGITPDKPEYADLMKAGSTLVGAASGALLDGAKGAAVGGNLALVNTTENFLNHPNRLALNKALATLRSSKDKNFFQEFFYPTPGVQDAAKETLALQYIDQRSDALLTAYRADPTSLTGSEKSELALYLGDYAKSNGQDATRQLIQFGPMAQMSNADIPGLTNYAKSELKIDQVHEGQALVGTPALMLAPGGVGALMRVVQVIQSGAQVGQGAAEIANGSWASGTVDVGLGLLGAVPVVAGEYQTVKAAATLPGKAANAGINATEDLALMLKKFDAGKINNFKPADEINAMMKGADWAPAWKPGTMIAETTLQPGAKVQMVVDEATYISLSKPGGDVSRAFGGWATFDNVPNQAYARNQLAITSDMKPSVGYVIEVEVTKPIGAQVGVVGAQGSALGGGNQLQFMMQAADRSSALKYVAGSGKALK